MTYSSSGKNDQEEKSPSSPNTPKRKWRSYVTVGRVFFCFLFIIMGCGIVSYGHYTDPGPLAEARTVVIPKGSVAHVTHILQQNDILAQGWPSAFFFRGAVFFSSRQGGIHAAELSFPSRVSVAHILDILRRGHPVTHSVTIAEGITAYRIAHILDKASALRGDTPHISEGSVYPQTFFYQWGTERRRLLQKMQSFMDKYVQQVWQQRDIAALDGKIETPQQLLILASIIERETSSAEERPKIARVFLNRLAKHMRLQTDPTVIYGLSQGKGVLDHSLSHDEIVSDNIYNTYKYEGLTPTPICSPSLNSLNAVAHPASGDALYFVSNGHGGHKFSKTIKEHIQYVREYRKFKQEHE